jgi:hypothetical protein
MYVRFRERNDRLVVSILETRRVAGQTKKEHVASLGSVPHNPTVDDRIAFWQSLHQRLNRLSNRIDAANQAKILGEVHARIPMVMLDEQRSIQLRNSETDEKFWSAIYDMNEAQIKGHEKLIATAQQKIAEFKTSAERASAKMNSAKGRVEKIKKGENVEGGLGKPFTLEDMIRILREEGCTKREFEEMLILAEYFTEDEIHELSWEMVEFMDRSRLKVIRAFLEKKYLRAPKK